MTPSPPPRLRDDFSLNHIEQGVLDFVGRLFPEQFRELEDYVARHLDFIDAVIATFDREIGFFIAYLSFIDPLRRAGLPFCHPEFPHPTRTRRCRTASTSRLPRS